VRIESRHAWPGLALLAVVGCGRIGFSSSGDATALADDAPGLAPGLVAWWKFDDGAGVTVTDATGHGHDGTLSNGDATTVAGPQWVAGQIGGAVSLDGIDDAIEFKNPASFMPPGDFTYAFWERVTAAQTNQTLIWFQNTSGTSELHVKHVAVDPVGSVEVDIAGNLPIANYNLGSFLGGWHHVAVTRAGAAVVFYLDATVIDHGTESAPIDLTGTCSMLVGQIACTPHTNQPAAVVIDDLRVYDRALSAAEVASLATP
jgi:uncharacterized protein